MVRSTQTQPYFLLGIVASLLEKTIAKAKVGFFTHLIYRIGLNTGNRVTLHDTFLMLWREALPALESLPNVLFVQFVNV